MLPSKLDLDLFAKAHAVRYFDFIDGNANVELNIPNLGQIPKAIRKAGFFTTHWSPGNLDPAAGDLLSHYHSNYSGDTVPLSPEMWGNNSRIRVNSIARSNDESLISSSERRSVEITAIKESLPAPEIKMKDRGDGSYLVTLLHSGRVPDGALIYFNTEGKTPTNAGEGSPVTDGQAYTGPFVWRPEPEEGGGDDGDLLEIGRGLNEVKISGITLRSKGQRVVQTRSYSFDTLAQPGFDGMRDNEVIDRSNEVISLEGLVLEQGGRQIVADQVNILNVTVTNLNFPPPADDYEVVLKERGKVIATLGDVRAGRGDFFAESLARMLSSTNLRDYVDYGTAHSRMRATDYDFDVRFSPLTNDDFLIVMERFGNSTFDLRALDVNGDVIAGSNRLVFREYSWNTGYAPSDYADQAFFLSAIDVEKFGVDTSATTIAGFRVNNDGGADFKFFTVGDESFDDREVRLAGRLQARVFPPSSLGAWFDPSSVASREVGGAVP